MTTVHEETVNLVHAQRQNHEVNSQENRRNNHGRLMVLDVSLVFSYKDFNMVAYFDVLIDKFFDAVFFVVNGVGDLNKRNNGRVLRIIDCFDNTISLFGLKMLHLFIETRDNKHTEKQKEQ